MGGFLAGEKYGVGFDYPEGSAVGKIKDEINPRLSLLSACPGSRVAGPVTTAEGGKLVMSDSTRGKPQAGTAFNKFLTENCQEGVPTVIVSSGPGAENALEAIRGNFQVRTKYCT